MYCKKCGNKMTTNVCEVCGNEQTEKGHLKNKKVVNYSLMSIILILSIILISLFVSKFNDLNLQDSSVKNNGKNTISEKKSNTKKIKNIKERLKKAEENKRLIDISVLNQYNYPDIDSYREGVLTFRISVDGRPRYGFIDLEGNELSPPVFETPLVFIEGFASVEVGGKWGFIDKTGNMVIDPIYSGPSMFENGESIVELDGKTYSINTKGERKLLESYNKSEYRYYEGLATAEKDGKWGFVDKSENFVIEPKYDYVARFSEGLAMVAMKNNDNTYTYGYIDKKGKEVIPIKYHIEDNRFYINNGTIFKKGMAVMGIKDEEGNIKMGTIDKNGNEIIKPIYDYISEFDDNDIAVVGLNRKRGYIDKSGDIVLPIKYDFISHFFEGTTVVGMDKEYWLLDIN